MIIGHPKTEGDNSENLFVSIVEKTKEDITKTIIRDKNYSKLDAFEFERMIYDQLVGNAIKTSYQNNIEYISGQRFPDIVAYVNKSKAFGLEVKTSRNDHWTTLGGSIKEGTRINNVERIYLLFAKFTNPFEIKYNKYENCIYNVVISHSPRYVIDMNLKPEDVLFKKLELDYDKLRKLDNPFVPIKAFLRKSLSKEKGEDIWWLDETTQDASKLIKLWPDLTENETKEYERKSFAYFPEILGNSTRKYKRVATWLLSNFNVINYSLRDTYSAGGRITIEGESFPKVFELFFSFKIKDLYKDINSISEEDLKFYWDKSIIEKDRKKQWKELILSYSRNNTLSDNGLNILKNKLHG